ncbi:MAG: DUF883 domain-containing protein [Gammaproteobacteria bacterium]|nr:DUF883 domain-containing protein [Gammaproteobacteria bacterium]
MSTNFNDPSADIGMSEQERARRSTTDRVAEKAHRTIDSAAETANEAERELRRSAAETAERVKRGEEQLAATVDENVEKVRTYIEKNPIASAGIAFVAGMVLSSLLRR